MKKIILCLLFTLLGGCSLFHPSSTVSSADVDDGGLKMACAHDPYLRKFGCSVPRIKQNAQSGDPDAQYALGYLYFYGIGLSRDSETGLLWIRRAAQRGQRLAREALVMIDNDQTFGFQQNYSYSGGGGGSRYQPRADVTALNQHVPDKPVTAHLPAYGNSKPASPSAKPAANSSTPPDSSLPPLSSKRALTSTVQDARLLKNSKPNSSYRSASQLGGQNDFNTGRLRSTTAAHSASNVHRFSKSRSRSIEPQRLTAAEKGFLSRHGYTIQLMGSHYLGSIKQFIERNKMQGVVKYYSTRFNGKPWYMLVYGEYASPKMAREAIGQLPPSVRHLHPWVKSFKIIQEEIKKRTLVS